MQERLCLLCVHAHPDDESSKGAGTVARYHEEGVRTVLVCCTGGEEGDVLNPAMDLPEIKQNLPEIRMRELARAAEIIGYDEVIMLGYRDSGMPGTEANADPRSFAAAPLDESTGRLVEIIRKTRPQVIVTYGDDQQGYPHPDHLRVHDISVAAFDAAGDPGAFTDAGDPWQASKMYYSVWSMRRIKAMHEKFLELGLESPFGEDWLSRPFNDEAITTTIDLAGHADVRAEALLAHETQVDPTSKFWFGLPPEVARDVHPYEEFSLARSLVESTPPEEDLFSGVRDRVKN
ncbi:MAG: mycothiol conjugate amidase Mca [Acidimicrobiales bacterium]